MKHLLLASSLVAALLSAAETSAQDTVRRGGSLARTPSYTSLLSSIAGTAASTQRVASRAVTVGDIRVVNAANVIGSDNDEPVRSALERHRDHVAALRNAVAANTVFTAALAAHRERPTASEVIAVDILDSGDVLVYFRRP